MSCKRDVVYLIVKECNSTLVIVNTAIVRGAEDGHDELEVIVLAPCVAQLMRANQEVESI